MPQLTRRRLLTAAGVTALSTCLPAGLALPATAAAADAARPRWWGHQPGRIYLGMGSQDAIDTAVAEVGRPIGLHRIYVPWANDYRRETDRISLDHEAARIPWVSFMPPYVGPHCWADIASGTFDKPLRARAKAWSKMDRPVIATFHHEPHVNGIDADPGWGTAQEYARAWIRVFDVMNDAADLRHVSFVPILSDWHFNPVNGKSEPDPFLPPDLLARCAFVGLDPYQNVTGQTLADRMPWVLDYLDRAGFPDKMIGIGETGACDSYPEISGADWWRASWDWAAANVDRVTAISYFNSGHHNFSGNTWLLSESPDKLAAYRASLDAPVSCRLP